MNYLLNVNDDEWKRWVITETFIWKNRQFAIIERDNKEKYMVYKTSYFRIAKRLFI